MAYCQFWGKVQVLQVLATMLLLVAHVLWPSVLIFLDLGPCGPMWQDILKRGGSSHGGGGEVPAWPPKRHHFSLA